MNIRFEKKFDSDPDWVPRRHEPIKCKHCGFNSFYVTDACWLCRKVFKNNLQTINDV